MKRGLRRMMAVWCTAVAVASCADITQPVNRIPAPVAGPSQQATIVTETGEELPYFANEGEIPQDYNPGVSEVRATVRWNGRVAEGYGSSKWFGNRGVLKLTLSLLYETSHVVTHSSDFTQRSILPQHHMLGQPLQYTVGSDCGHTANFFAHQSAQTVVWLADFGTWSIGSTDTEAQASATQPSCPKEEDEDAPPGEEGGSGPSDGGGSSGGGADTGGTRHYCETTTYSVQRWNGDSWQHEYYETETQCYSL